MQYSTKKIATSLIAVAVLLAGWVGFAQVQDKAKEKPTTAKKAVETKDADEEAIRHSAAAFTTAYNAHNANAVSELFALKAELTDEDGNLIKGREAIEKEFASQFLKFPEARIEIEIGSIRVLTQHIALEEGIVRGQPTPDGPVNVSSYVAVHVKVDGHWQLASVTDFEVASDDLTPNDHLQQLAWMEGDWLDESSESTVKSSCRWDESGHYLLHDFFLQIAGSVSASGSMRIGWDPLSKQLKSWTFDADSGYAEGLWTRIGDEWMVRSHGVNAEGKVTSAISVFRYVNKDTMTWRAYDRVIGGEPADDVPENVIKRHAPPPEG